MSLLAGFRAVGCMVSASDLRCQLCCTISVYAENDLRFTAFCRLLLPLPVIIRTILYPGRFCILEL